MVLRKCSFKCYLRRPFISRCDTVYLTSDVELSIWVSIAGTVIASLVCGDSDSGPTPGCTGYNIQSGDDSPQKFTISGNSIQTTSTPIDYELLSAQNFMYTLVVTASDDPLTDSPKTGSSTVLVRITPLNDNDPVFTPNSYTAQVCVNWLNHYWIEMLMFLGCPLLAYFFENQRKV